MDITVRKAGLNDLDILLDFEQGVINAERPFDPSIKEGDVHYYDIADMIVAAHIEVVVAELGDEIIGCGYARIEDSKVYLKHRQHAYLGFMYVKPEHRGKGVNNLIVKMLKDWSRSQNVTEMRLEVYSSNLPAIKAYEKAGFTADLLQMRIDLSGS